jgi:hypothetical protein
MSASTILTVCSRLPDFPEQIDQATDLTEAYRVLERKASESRASNQEACDKVRTTTDFNNT